ncbi:hypothetical protein JGUZn3_08690 [Entomobacter blattae]|uniref:Uncharacterized protein n=1 Tax=Entomobacter blattae TaxID=2762277 RepID=A0A7H1NQP1_9PROT|nr:hypothetical protein JGUZn3_08690 [Entomobacter blattae]
MVIEKEPLEGLAESKQLALFRHLTALVLLTILFLPVGAGSLSFLRNIVACLMKCSC